MNVAGSCGKGFIIAPYANAPAAPIISGHPSLQQQRSQATGSEIDRLFKIDHPARKPRAESIRAISLAQGSSGILRLSLPPALSTPAPGPTSRERRGFPLTPATTHPA